MGAVIVMGMFFGVLERVVSWLIPGGLRESVLGDLTEEFGSPGQFGRLSAMLSIVFRLHIEPYRSIDRSLSVLGLLAIGLGLLWIIPIASGTMFVAVDGALHPVYRAAAMLWGSPHVTASIATGLVMGRVPLSRGLGTPVRLHIGVMLGVLLFLSLPDFATELVAIGLFFSMMFVGDRARQYHPLLD